MIYAHLAVIAMLVYAAYRECALGETAVWIIGLAAVVLL